MAPLPSLLFFTPPKESWRRPRQTLLVHRHHCLFPLSLRLPHLSLVLLPFIYSLTPLVQLPHPQLCLLFYPLRLPARVCLVRLFYPYPHLHLSLILPLHCRLYFQVVLLLQIHQQCPSLQQPLRSAGSLLRC